MGKDDGSDSEPSIDNLSERELQKVLPQKSKKKFTVKKEDSKANTGNNFFKGRRRDNIFDRNLKNMQEKDVNERTTLKVERSNADKVLSPTRSRSIRE